MTKKIQSLQRAISTLNCLSRSYAMSLAELSEATGLHKSTLLRILETLMDEKWVYKNFGDGKYRIAADIPLDNRLFDRDQKMREGFGTLLDDLLNQIPWPSDVAVYQNGRMQIIESSRLVSPLKVNRVSLGLKPHMLWSAHGRAYLAFCNEGERTKILDVLKRSNDQEDQPACEETWLKDLMCETREKGYGLRDPHYGLSGKDFTQRINAIAIPIFQDEEIAGTLSVVWLANIMSEREVVESYLTPLKNAAQSLSDHILASH